MKAYTRPAFVFVLLVCYCLLVSPLASFSQSGNVKALVGGTLVDGYGSKPIRNSVIILEGERIKAVGQIGSLRIPAGAEIISTEGMTVLPGLWDIRPSDDQRSQRLCALGQDLSAADGIGDHAGLGQAVIDGRRDQRARSGRASESEHRRARSD